MTGQLTGHKSVGVTVKIASNGKDLFRSHIDISYINVLKFLAIFTVFHNLLGTNFLIP